MTSPLLPAKEYAILPVPRNLIALPDSTPPRQHVLWIGCSDSLVSETDCLDINRDEIFVHRNLGGRVSNGDLSSGSALEWAVDLLKVDYIVVCGHYDCEVIKHELAGKELSGWEMEVSKLDPNARRPSNILHMSSERSREQRLEETYLLHEVDWLKKEEHVQRAIRERGLIVHTFVYDKTRNECVRLVEE
ncbi:Carbonate deHydratase [Hyphodiscus hymeniophilus]|uniref:Carbonic anhydrase n=1 Tax=Hyphodiscus hymeniophilus TaxID=353542 RepID=A0A9P6SN34_9HELO|nr:Carbonate deHydratase [Hyphodiscus hymeniophilus]